MCEVVTLTERAWLDGRRDAFHEAYDQIHSHSIAYFSLAEQMENTLAYLKARASGNDALQWWDKAD